MPRPRSLASRAAIPILAAIAGVIGVWAWGTGRLPYRHGTAAAVDRPADQTQPIAQRASRFPLPVSSTDLDNRPVNLRPDPSQRATIVVVLSTTCPISNGYLPLLNRLSAACRVRQVGLVGVLGEPGIDLDEARRHFADHAVDFPVLPDESGDVRRQLEPTHVPEAFLFDRDGVLCYRGRIDDQYAEPGRKRAAAARRDLVEALDELLAGRPVSVSRTEPVGCLLEPPGQSNAGTVTWSGDIAPLVRARCVACHRPGAVAPFPLLSYNDVARRARQIHAVLASRAMPPWKAEPGFGRFHDERRLDDEQIAMFGRWIECGKPLGNLAEAPPPPEFPDGWQLGRPDLVLEMPQPVTIPADGPDIYQYFVIPTRLTVDRAVSAIEFRPGNPRVVHHASFRYDDTGAARRLDAADPFPGYRRFGGWGFSSGGTLGGWALGVLPRRFPVGVGQPLPAGSDFVLQVHYHPTGRAETDRSTIGLYFHPADRPSRDMVELFVANMDLEIPAGTSRYHHAARYMLPADVTLYSVLPHMHLLGRRVRATARRPDGRVEPLIAIEDWDFNWQSVYHLARPLALPAGTLIEFDVWYDNTAGNPQNPHDPPRTVRWGEGSDDEMGVLYLNVVADRAADQPGLLAQNRREIAVQFDRIMQRWYADRPTTPLTAPSLSR